MTDFSTLLDGYQRFRDTGWAAQRDRWAALHKGQRPDVMVIACSDSRVEPTRIFDTDPGEMFVVRNVAALVPPFETTQGHHGVSAALEFAVQFLGVKEIVVLGHGMCGGCAAALSQDLHGMPLGKGGFVSEWISMLDNARQNVIESHGAESIAAQHAMEHAAVQVSLDNLRTFPCIQEKEACNEIKLIGAWFAISDGILHVLDETAGEFQPSDTDMDQNT